MNGHFSFLEYWVKMKCESTVKGAEPIASCFSRSVSFMEEILKKHEEENVLVVSHGGVIGFLLCRVLGMNIADFWKFQFKNTSVSEVQFSQGSFRVTLLNDISHLGRGFFNKF